MVFVLQGPVTVDELLEMGRAKLMSHDLALEMSRLSETSETLASEKQVGRECTISFAHDLTPFANLGVGDVSRLCGCFTKSLQPTMIRCSFSFSFSASASVAVGVLAVLHLGGKHQGAGEAAFARISGAQQVPGRGRRARGCARAREKQGGRAARGVVQGKRCR